MTLDDYLHKHEIQLLDLSASHVAELSPEARTELRERLEASIKRDTGALTALHKHAMRYGEGLNLSAQRMHNVNVRVHERDKAQAESILALL